MKEKPPRRTEAETAILGGPQPFPRTSWSLVRLVQDPGAPAYRAGLDKLFRKYWGPVYYFIRRNWNKTVEEAKDLTQAFFCAFLEKDFVRSVRADRGKFRSFLCAALRHFLSKERRFAAAKKRSPGEIFPLEGVAPEIVPASSLHPDDQFAEDWKRAVVEASLERVRREAAAKGKEVLVDLLVRYELEEDPERRPRYQELAKEYGLTVYQVTNGLHWARKAFKTACLEELRDQVTSEEDLRSEARKLFGIDP